MLKQGLQQTMKQGLSPLQIQTIKLLELPTLELEQKIKKELEENPVLDEAPDSEQDSDDIPKNISLSEYASDDPTPSYKYASNNQSKDLKPQYNTFSVKESFFPQRPPRRGRWRFVSMRRACVQATAGPAQATAAQPQAASLCSPHPRTVL